MTVVSSVLRIAKSATPLGLLYVGKLIINQIIAISHNHGIGHLSCMATGGDRVWAWLLASDALSRVITLMDSLLGDLFSNHTSVKNHGTCRYARP